MSTTLNKFYEKINSFSPLEHSFTEVLSSIALKPKTLYFYGKIPENMSKKHIKTAAIVGSRHNTKYGEEIAYNLAHKLAQRGVVIVSGLAYGIDSIAHRGALDANGHTIAVLGNPIDKIHPTAHTNLAIEIIRKNGAIISEYPPSNSKAPLVHGEFYDKNSKRQINYKTSFLYRNRLISGLSDIVVVVEAAEKSGSLSTATHALNQGKTVFAVPGNITNPYSQGCNKLIKQGAIPCTHLDDILHELFPEECAKKQQKLHQLKLFGDTDVETRILQSLANGLRTSEEIMTTTYLPPEVFNETITLLEIKSRVRSLGMNSWSLI